SFASIIRSTSARLMRSSGLPPKNGSSQRSLVLSSPAVALCEFSLSQRTTASFQVRRGLSPSIPIRHDSDFSRSCSSCAWALLPVPADRRTRSPFGDVMSIHQTVPRLQSDIYQTPFPSSLATLAEEENRAS